MGTGKPYLMPRFLHFFFISSKWYLCFNTFAVRSGKMCTFFPLYSRDFSLASFIINSFVWKWCILMTNALGRLSLCLCRALCDRSIWIGLVKFSAPSSFVSNSAINSVGLSFSSLSAMPTSRILLRLERDSRLLHLPLNFLHSSISFSHCFSMLVRQVSWFVVASSIVVTLSAMSVCVDRNPFSFCVWTCQIFGYFWQDVLSTWRSCATISAY